MKPQLPEQCQTQREVSVHSIKESFVHISIDPGSVSCGIAVFDLNGRFIDSFEVKANPGMIASMRIFSIHKAFEAEWRRRFGDKLMANFCSCENLPPSRLACLHLSPGAILASGVITADLHPSSYISPSAWKYVARELGSKEKDPKGRKILTDIGWGFEMPTGDDAADAIIIYLACRWYKGMHVWISPTKLVKSTYVKKTRLPKTKKRAVKNDESVLETLRL